MKKLAVILISSMGLMLGGCGDASQTEIPVAQEGKSPEDETFVNQAEQESELEIVDISSVDAVSTDVRQGESYDEIALYFSLKNITPTGATLVFDQYDADASKGQLEYGDDYVIEVLRNGEWEEAPIVVEGDYGFHDIAYTLPCENITQRESDWNWLYGELEPGEYRIGKSVLDFIESGNFDKYMVYAHFVLYGENECSVGIVHTDASDALRVREEPDGNSPVVMLLPNGEEVAILAEENEFYKISWQEEGETAEGYVSKKYVDVESEEE